MKSIIKNIVNKIFYNRKSIRQSIIVSFVASILATGLFVLLYQKGREVLVNAINNKSIAILQKFDLMNKIHDKMGFETVPTIWDMQSHYGMLLKFALSLFVLSLFLFYMPIKNWDKRSISFFPSINIKLNLKENLGWKLGLTVLVVMFYSIFSTFLYLCWMGGDDWYSTMSSGLSLVSRLCWWGWCWATHVSRLGEMLVYIHPLTLDRWQHYLITPLFWISFPFIIKYMIGKYADFMMCSAKGLVFYMIMVSLTLMGINSIMLPTCYIVSANYVYGPILNILYFALVFHLGNNKTSIIGVFSLSLLALVSGWYTEGIAIIGLFVLLCYIGYCFYNNITINIAKYISIIFYFIGVCNVLFSPGPIVRGALSASSITGGNIPYNLVSLGLFERFTYLPEWLHSIWMPMRMDFILIIVFSVLVYVFRRKVGNDRLWIPVSAFIAVGLLSALAYLIGGAIPNASTYIPSCYMLCVSIAILFATLLDIKPLIGIIISVLFTIYFVISIGDRIMVLMPLKHYETEMYEEIIRQREMGVEHVVLDYPFEKEIKEPGVEIACEANKFECAFFKIKSIKMKSFEETHK